MQKGINIMLFLCLCFHSCKIETKDVPGAILSVGNRVLTQSMLQEVLPKGLSSKDSTAFADAYIRHWIEDELLYLKAQNNIPDVARIDRMVDLYRRELFVHEYQKQLLNEKLDNEISEDVARNYYRVNLDKFVLRIPIIKGLFLKVSETAPHVEDLKKWYKSNDYSSVENIEKYSLHNIVNYEYFNDYWVSFDEVKNNIPITISDDNRFLQANKAIEINHDGYWYLLSIYDYLPTGSTMPFEYARAGIEELLKNKQRQQFIQEINDELYQEALKERKIKYKDQ